MNGNIKQNRTKENLKNKQTNTSLSAAKDKEHIKHETCTNFIWKLQRTDMN